MTTFDNQKRQEDIARKAHRDAIAAGEEVEEIVPADPGFVQTESSREPIIETGAMTDDDADLGNDDDAGSARKSTRRPAKRTAKKATKAAKKR